jgi:hypothetical protein
MTALFKLRGKEYRHLRDGWCVRQVQLPTGTAVWRLYWGPVTDGSTSNPSYVTAYEAGNQFVQFNELADAVAWVNGRAR